MTTRPEKKSDARLCLSVRRDGLTAYGNTQAFQSLAEWLSWLSKSDPKEHFECHVTMALEDDASLFEGKRPRNVWTVADHAMRGIVTPRSSKHPGFELTFMMAGAAELDQMAKKTLEQPAKQMRRKRRVAQAKGTLNRR